MPPVEYQKAVDAGAAYDELTHEPLTDVRLAELACKRNAAADHHACADSQVLHHRVVNGPGRIVEEHIHTSRASFLHRGDEVMGFFIIDCRIEADLAAPPKFAIVTGNGDGTAPRQFGDLA